MKTKNRNYFFDLPYELILYIFDLIPRTRTKRLKI